MENKRANIVCEKRIEKYRKISERALRIAEENIAKGREKEAQEILAMAKSYLSDSRYFEKIGNLVNSFAAINYAHGWLDSGARLGIFRVKDRKLFTIA